ncbi:MAG: S16 family serine protease [Ignavibacteriales bacterium]
MKLYEKIKKIIREYYISILIVMISTIVFVIPFPYYINAPGGLIDMSKRIQLDDAYESKGSINMAYVTELKATIPTLIVAYFKKNWDIIKMSDVKYDNQTIAEMNFRDRMLLKEAGDNAIIVAYNKLGKTAKIINQDLVVTYVDEKANTDLAVGDIILEIEGQKVNNYDSLVGVIQGYEENDVINIKVKNDDKIINRKATLYYDYDRVVVGIVLTPDLTLETNPKIDLKFERSESGPSGGLMTAIAIYDSLTKEDLTKGKTIVGTGTIDVDGNVGSIGGVEYKLRGAIKEKADVFLVPSGDNYNDAMKLKEESNFDIKIVSINTFDQAIKYLEEQL